MEVSDDLVKVVRVTEHEFHNSMYYHFCRRQKSATSQNKKKIGCNSLGLALGLWRKKKKRFSMKY